MSAFMLQRPASVLGLTLLTMPLAAQQVLWRADNPPQGPFGTHLAMIGDKDGDGYDDLVTTVYIPVGGGITRIPQIWFFSGRDGHVIGRGLQDFNQLARAGDIDGDGVADYVITGNGDWLDRCAPWRCVGVEAHSGRTDAVLWRANVPRDLDMGTLVLADLDLDGDGWPDVLMGSPVAAVPAGGLGMLYAFNRYGQVMYQVLSAPQESFLSIAKFIDYDHDGCDDFLIGLYEPSGIGAADIVSGRTGARMRRIYGVPPVLWGYGASVAMAGDLDGDGVPDIVLGDSGPGTPGVLEALSSVTGNLIHRWQVNQSGGDDLGWPYLVADVDVDRDGVTDVIAQCWGQTGRGLFIFSGRDGSVILNSLPVTLNMGNIVAVPRQPGDLFPRFMTRGTFGNAQSIYMYSGAPPGVTQSGSGGQGTLASAPQIGLRQFGTTGFRITLAGAEPFAPTLLVLGLTQPSVPYVDLGLLGFTGCTLFPNTDVIGFVSAGGTGVASGYAAHDFRRQLMPSAVGNVSYQVFAQWVTLGHGATWPGGVTEAASLFIHY